MDSIKMNFVSKCNILFLYVRHVKASTTNCNVELYKGVTDETKNVRNRIQESEILLVHRIHWR